VGGFGDSDGVLGHPIVRNAIGGFVLASPFFWISGLMRSDIGRVRRRRRDVRSKAAVSF
jgi:hypothetical protein